MCESVPQPCDYLEQTCLQGRNLHSKLNGWRSSWGLAVLFFFFFFFFPFWYRLCSCYCLTSHVVVIMICYFGVFFSYILFHGCVAFSCGHCCTDHLVICVYGHNYWPQTGGSNFIIFFSAYHIPLPLLG